MARTFGSREPDLTFVYDGELDSLRCRNLACLMHTLPCLTGTGPATSEFSSGMTTLEAIDWPRPETDGERVVNQMKLIDVRGGAAILTWQSEGQPT